MKTVLVVGPFVPERFPGTKAIVFGVARVAGGLRDRPVRPAASGVLP
jgi:hypothetical protein